VNRPVSRALLIGLCRALGHDPSAVASINVYPDRVSVVYDHFVDGGADESFADTIGGAR
jgi:hypothetical protein